MSDSISTLKNKGLPADALAFIESLPADQASKLADTLKRCCSVKSAGDKSCTLKPRPSYSS